MENSIYERARKITEGKVCGRHTFFQLKHFVLGKELTTQAKLQKCVREIDARRRSLKSMILALEDLKDELEVLSLKESALEKKKTKGALDNGHKAIQKRKLARRREMLLDSVEETEQKMKETEEETEFFIKAFEQLEKVEPLRRHDDPESNAELWNETFAQDLRLRLMLQKPIDLELVKCILALGTDSPVRNEMVGILEQIQRRALSHKIGGDSDG